MIDITFAREDGPEGLKKALDNVTDEACKAARAGYQLLILSDRKAGESRQVAVFCFLFIKIFYHMVLCFLFQCDVICISGYLLVPSWL